MRTNSSNHTIAACMLCALLIGACKKSAPQSFAEDPQHPDAGGAVHFAELLDPSEAQLAEPRPALLPLIRPEDVPPSVLPLEDDGRHEFDSLTYVRRKPFVNQTLLLADHPLGKVLFRTNGIGLREDSELPTARQDLRVLVAGDSHTEGVCNNDESFANLTEAHLRALAPGAAIDVVNAGTGYFTFPSYLGTLIKFLPLDPDVFVICVFGGNDFGVLPGMRTTLRGGPVVLEPKPYRRRIFEAMNAEVDGRQGYPSVHQGFNQLAFLAAHPELTDAILEDALAYSAEIERIATKHDIRCIWLYLPPCIDAEPARFRAIHALVTERLQLTPQQLGATDRLADRYLEGLRDLGAQAHDLRPLLSGKPQPMYWYHDEHLGLAGHAAVAELLTELLREDVAGLPKR